MSKKTPGKYKLVLTTESGYELQKKAVDRTTGDTVYRFVAYAPNVERAKAMIKNLERHR